MAQSREERLAYLRRWREKKRAEDPGYSNRMRRKWEKENPEKLAKLRERWLPRQIERAKERYWERHGEYRAKSRAYHAQTKERYIGKRREAYTRDIEQHRERGRARYAKKPRYATPGPDGKWKTKADLARWALTHARWYGFIDKPDHCSECGFKPKESRFIHGHHTDYDKPFVVEWLCSTCHGKRHRKLA